MPLNPEIHVAKLPEMSAAVVGTPEYILPFLIDIRTGLIENQWRLPNAKDILAGLNIAILNTELMIENSKYV